MSKTKSITYLAGVVGGFLTVVIAHLIHEKVEPSKHLLAVIPAGCLLGVYSSLFIQENDGQEKINDLINSIQ